MLKRIFYLYVNEGQRIRYITKKLNDETGILLPHKKTDSTISVKVKFGEGDGNVPIDDIAKRVERYKAKERVTYKMIKEYI